MFILLILISILLLTYSILTTFLVLKASSRIEYYELFFRDTLIDIDHAKNIFDQLVNKKEYLADNSDIQQIQQVFAITLEILQGYMDNGRKFFQRKKETKKKEKK